MNHRESVMTETEDMGISPQAQNHSRRLRQASLAFNVGTLLITPSPSWPKRSAPRSA